jgi:signal transduction histidine kinase
MADIVQVAGERSPATDPLLTKLNSVQQRLKGQIRDLRLFCSELRPPTLVPFGLEKAIRSHAEAFQNRYEKLTVHLDLMPDGHLLPEQIRLALFRIYQEMLNNVARHSQANEVTVRFQLDDRQAVLEIIDNGRGFQVPAAWVEMARHGHLGLVGAQERAQAVGGSLSITSAPEAGTRVQVWVPRDQQNGDQ